MGKNLLLAICAFASVSVQAQKMADPQPFAKTITTTSKVVTIFKCFKRF
jgi:hypothetical protein